MLIGYLDHTPEHEETFWCLLCKKNQGMYDVPVFRENVGIYSQVCDCCGRIVIDGLKKAANDTEPLCLFGQSA